MLLQKKLYLLPLLIFWSLLPYSAYAIDDTGLVSWWSLDETSGVRYDEHGSNDLTDNNTVGYTTGLQGNAADFDKTNLEYLSITDASQTGLDLTSDFSFLTCYKSSNTDGQNKGILGKYSSGANERSYALYVPGNTDGGGTAQAPEIYVSSTGLTSSYILKRGNTAVNDGSWHQIAATFDASESDLKLYVDGSQATLSRDSSAGTVTSILDNAQPFQIAAHNSTSVTGDAAIDEVAIYNVVLTSAEVAEHWASGSCLSYSDLSAETPTATTSTSSTTFEDDNIVFMLSIIIFLLAFLWFGFIMSGFKRMK